MEDTILCRQSILSTVPSAVSGFRPHTSLRGDTCGRYSFSFASPPLCLAPQHNHHLKIPNPQPTFSKLSSTAAPLALDTGDAAAPRPATPERVPRKRCRLAHHWDGAAAAPGAGEPRSPSRPRASSRRQPEQPPSRLHLRLHLARLTRRNPLPKGWPAPRSPGLLHPGCCCRRSTPRHHQHN